MLETPETRGTTEFDEAVDRAIRAAVRKQADAGLDRINDGEQGRISYSVDVTTRLSGFSEGTVAREWPADLEDVPEYGRELLGEAANVGGPVATGPIEYVGGEQLARELGRFEDAVAAEEVEYGARFHTAPSPGAVLRFTETEHYASREEYLFELAEALHAEYTAIVEAGATLQIDAPDLLAGFTLTHKDATVEAFRRRIGTHVESINRALDGIAPEQVRLHGCWGNYPGPHHRDVPLAAVIDQLYRADVGGLVVEGANPRHQHEHRVFADHPLPDGWELIAGVVDVKTNVVEHPEVVANRLERFADAVGDPARLVAAPDCGFATVVDGANVVHPSVVGEKLGTLVDGARLASDRLSG